MLYYAKASFSMTSKSKIKVKYDLIINNIKPVSYIQIANKINYHYESKINKILSSKHFSNAFMVCGSTKTKGRRAGQISP
jgi:hypothetical protein